MLSADDANSKGVFIQLIDQESGLKSMPTAHSLKTLVPPYDIHLLKKQSQLGHQANPGSLFYYRRFEHVSTSDHSANKDLSRTDL